MKRFWIFAGLLLSVMLLLFFAGQALNLPFLAEDTGFWLGQEKWIACLLGVGLLIVDVIAPVPSSIIMFANGILFGPVWGTALSIVGAMGAATAGYWIGCKGERAGKRWLGGDALSRANAFFVRYGMMAIIVSRPVPILAEAIGIIAGMSRMPPAQFHVAALMGILPTAALYGIAGAYSVELNNSLYVFVVVMLIAGIVWAIGKLLLKPARRSSGRAQ